MFLMYFIINEHIPWKMVWRNILLLEIVVFHKTRFRYDEIPNIKRKYFFTSRVKEDSKTILH